MDTQTVQQLRAAARELGLKGYSRLKKTDLVKLLEQHATVRYHPPRGIVNFINEEKNFEGGTLLDENLMHPF